MHNKTEEPVLPAPEQQLEAKVDAMMEVSADESTATNTEVRKPEQSKANDGLPPLDIFADPSTAPDVPKDLLKQLDKADNITKVDEAPKVEEPAETLPTTAETQLDDAMSDAAIDDIVAHESDDTLKTEDTEQAEAAVVTQPVEKVPKLHHHPVFWTIIFLLCVVATIAAYLLVTGGSNLPGSGLVNKLSGH